VLKSCGELTPVVEVESAYLQLLLLATELLLSKDPPGVVTTPSGGVTAPGLALLALWW